LAEKEHGHCVFPREKNYCAHCRGNGVSPKARVERYREEKNFLPLTVFILLAVLPAKSIGRIKDEF